MHYHTPRNEDDLRSKQGEIQVRKTAFFATLCLAISTAAFAAPPASTPAPAMTPATETTPAPTKTTTTKKPAMTPTPTPTPGR